MRISAVTTNSIVDAILLSVAKELGYFYNKITKTTDLDSDEYSDILILEVPNSYTAKDLRNVRLTNPDSHIIGIQTGGNWNDKLMFLQECGDDCLVYPFKSAELKLKILAAVRKRTNIEDSLFIWDRYTVNLTKRIVLKEGSPVYLRKIEYSILDTLIRNKDRAVSRNEIASNIYTRGEYYTSNNIDAHICALRKKLGKNFIVTVFGRGYKVNNKKSSRKKILSTA